MTQPPNVEESINALRMSMAYSSRISPIDLETVIQAARSAADTSRLENEAVYWLKKCTEAEKHLDAVLSEGE